MLRRNSKYILSAAKYLILLTGLCGITLFAQPYTNDIKKILQFQDIRSSDFGQIYDLMKEGNDKIKIAGLQYYANSGDSGCIIYIEKILDEPNSTEVRSAGYFALGQIPSEISRQTLNKYLSKETEPFVLASVIDAIGRVGNIDDLNAITQLTSTNDMVRSAIAMSIARFGLRKIKTDKAYVRLAELMESSADSTLRKNIIFAFSRTADKQTLQAFNTELITSSTSPEPYARMWGFSALGKEQDTSLIPYFLESLDKEYDWRVKASIVNALGNLAIDMNSPILEKTVTTLLRLAAQEPNVHVSIVSWQALGKIFKDGDTRNPLVRMIQQNIQFILTPGKAIDWQIKAEAIRTYAKIFKDESKADLFALFNSTDNYDIKSAIVGSFGYMNDPMVYKELRENISNDVMKYNELHPNKDGSMIGSNDLAKMYRAFVDALTELDDKLDTENRNIIRLILSEFSSSKDPVLVDNCLTNLQDSMYIQYREETCQIMTFDYNSFVFPKDRDAALMYIQAWDNMKYEGAKDILTANLKSNDYDIAIASANALKNITGKSYEKDITAQKYRTDFDWAYIEKLGEMKIATIKTNRGDIKIELFNELTPFTVQNFVKLSEHGYYNNTIFHRVVPNFVIQGGDPTGTGYGGPGYSIRSEFTPLPFDAYTVGMASSGKDTEGSQFFITHSPQPHLDGKYTLFGKVIEGFDVVDNIQIGDTIENISFSSR